MVEQPLICSARICHGSPDWSLCSAGDLSKYPSVHFKLLNIRNLKEHNIQKYEQGIKKLKDFLFPK